MVHRHVLAGALALAHPLAAAAASLSRAPYLQSVAPTSAVVAFRTDVDCPASVRLERDGAAVTAPSASTGRTHEVKVDGLVPGATYAYAVEACGATVFGGGRLRTAPAPGSRRVHFVAFGDFGTGTPDQAAVVRAIEQADPELVLGAGDVAYDSGTAAELEAKFFRPMATLLSGTPIYTAIGNHEYLTDAGGPYLESLVLPANNPAASELYYSFDWGHVHFVTLDSNCLIQDTARCSGAAQRAWLAEDLAASDAAFKVVMLHHPFWTTGMKRNEEAVRRAVAPVLEASGVDLVLNGHDHNYQRTVPMRGDGPAAAQHGVRYVTVGNGGANLDAFMVAQPPWMPFRDDAHRGFLDVTVEGGVLQARMISASGAVLDAFTIEKDLPPAPSDGSGTGPGAGLTRPAAGCGSTGAGHGAASLGAGALAALALGLSRRLARVPVRTRRISRE